MRYDLIAKNIGRRALPWVVAFVVLNALPTIMIWQGWKYLPGKNISPTGIGVLSFLIFVLGILGVVGSIFIICNMVENGKHPQEYLDSLISCLRSCEKDELARESKKYKSSADIIDEIDRLREELNELEKEEI